MCILYIWWWWWALMLFCFWNLMTHDIVDDFWLLASMTIMMWVTMTSPVSLFHKKVRKPSRPGFSSGRIANLYLNITNSPARQLPPRLTFYFSVQHFWLYTMYTIPIVYQYIPCIATRLPTKKAFGPVVSLGPLLTKISSTSRAKKIIQCWEQL